MGCLPGTDERQASSTLEGEELRGWVRAGTFHRAGHRAAWGCSPATAIPSLLCRERLGSLCCRPCRRPEQLQKAEPQPLPTGGALWLLPGVAATTALTANRVGRSFIAGEISWMPEPVRLIFPLSLSDDLGFNCTASSASRGCSLFYNTAIC